jgi:hypothetical protein
MCGKHVSFLKQYVEPASFLISCAAPADSTAHKKRMMDWRDHEQGREIVPNWMHTHALFLASLPCCTFAPLALSAFTTMLD